MKTQDSIAEKVKILAFSDTHGKDLRHLVEKAEKEGVKLVFACGDWSAFDELPPYLVGQFKKKGMKMFVQTGNHENFATSDALAEKYGIMHMHGDGVIYNDVGFFGAGGATQIGPNGLIDEDELFALLKQGFEKVKGAKTKVMLVHEHPEGTIFELGRFPGSSAIRRAITEFKPEVVICGHIHEASGVEDKIGQTRIINVAKEGKILEF
jgi:Icc-related predicted phosphoesterase